MTSSEIYELAYKHNMHIDIWYDKLVQDALDTLIRQGFYDPKCYALSYSYELGEYATTVVAMDPDSLTDPEKNDSTYKCLQNIDKSVNYTLLGIMFISEGTVKNDNVGTSSGFIIMCFEDKIKGWKKVYRLTKHQTIDRQNNFKAEISDLFYDDDTSQGHNIPILERYSHILRPNYSNKSDWIYN